MGATLDGKPLLVATIDEPRVGRWVAYCEADSDEDITGSATLSFESGAVDLVGTVHRGALESGRWIGFVVGGTGGLSTTLTPRAYRNCPLSTALTDIINTTGETLGADSETLTGQFVAHWQRIQGTATHAMAALADEMGYSWRVDRDGTLWLGADTYAELEADVVELQHHASLGMKVVAPAAEPTIRPAVTWDGWRVEHVTTRLRDGKLRQEVWRVATD